MASRSTRTSSASNSSRAVTEGLTLRELAAHGVAELKAVGPKLEVGLAEMGITSVLDLLDHYPRRYVDRTERAEIAELSIGDEATVDAEVRSIRSRRTRDGKRTIVNAVVYDGTGLLELVFFNQAWRERQLAVGTQISLFGKVEQYRGKRQLTNPVVDVLSAPDSERGPGEGTGGDRRDRARLPAIGEGRGAHVAAPPRRRSVAPAHQGEGLRRPAPCRAPRPARARRPHAAPIGTSTVPRPCRTRGSPRTG